MPALPQDAVGLACLHIMWKVSRMKLCYFGKDGGAESTVWGFWPVEIKSLFSVALLCFENGSRDAYHDHAFNSLSWVLSGQLLECPLDGPSVTVGATCDGAPYPAIGGDQRPVEGVNRVYRPSWRPIWTPRRMFHKVVSTGRSWVLTLRGPWSKTWQEYLPAEKRYRTLMDGRKEITERQAGYIDEILRTYAPQLLK